MARICQPEVKEQQRRMSGSNMKKKSIASQVLEMQPDLYEWESSIYRQTLSRSPSLPLSISHSLDQAQSFDIAFQPEIAPLHVKLVSEPGSPRTIRSNLPVYFSIQSLVRRCCLFVFPSYRSMNTFFVVFLNKLFQNKNKREFGANNILYSVGTSFIHNFK